jgi:poly(3-hydroxybutyrate) depolymerase
VYFLSVNESVSFWVEHNNCNHIPKIETSASGNIIKQTYANGTNGLEVLFYKTIDGDHWWPGNAFTDPTNTSAWLVDTIQEISATDLIWEFFEKHSKE